MGKAEEPLSKMMIENFFAGRGIRFAFAGIVLMLTVLALFPHASRAELHVGTARIPIGYAWDFSDSLASKDGDIYQVIVRRVANASQYPYGLKSASPAALAFAPGDSTYTELQTAPADTTLYFGAVDLYLGLVCVVRTRELHYAKFQVLNYSDQWVDIEYTYQDDGSRVLTDTVPVEATTWGRLKSLYRD